MTEKELVEQANVDKPLEYMTEKGDKTSYHSKESKNTIEDEEDIESLQHGTQRGLSARHIQMISLGGCIG